ncbi:hypothetical protein GG344DRAFT_42180 [Lentinula edodes]|nr:hypothetical protein GG344DRAFT_42180 [Lentinula edodes]
MSLTASQKSAISSVLDVLLTAVATPPSKAKPGDIGVGGTGIGTGRGRKRLLSGMFLVLLDRNDWAEYYDLIPNPRALHPIRDSLAENKYTNALEVYTDLSLVFWNAIFYNERDSQISKDAAVLKNLLDIEWAKRADLPQPKSRSPPPGSAQKTYPEIEEKEREREREIERQIEMEKEKEKEKERNAKSSEIQTPQPSQLLYQPQSTFQPQLTFNSVPDIVDMDVDMPDTESEVDQTDTEAEADDEAEDDGIDEDIIIHQLENSLPRWPGFYDNEEEGWLTEGNTGLYLELIHALKGHKDVIGNRLAAVLEAIPDVIDGPTSTTKGKLISIKAIEARIKSNAYPTAASFDKDVMLLFEKGRRWVEYAQVLILQRLYQSLTSPYLPDRPKPNSGPPYSSETNFASLRVGPGRPNPHQSQNPSVAEENPTLTSGLKQIHTIMENRTFLDQVKYKGWTVRVGDWVHLANGSDMYSGTGAGAGGGAGRPIVAQVWKVWQMQTNATSASTNDGITVCWYYRPEETFHSSQRVFWENEVFKSNHFASHPVSDILEPIFVQHTRAHIRGRPRGNERRWYPGWPLYVCDSRYSYSKGYRNHQNRARAFFRIKNWNSCLPPEISKGIQQLIYPFEKTVFPVRRPSPFTVGGGGPGGLVEDRVSGTVSGPTKGVLAGSADVAKSVATAIQYLQQYANVQSQSQPYSQPYQRYQSSSVPAPATTKASKPDRTSTAYAMAQAQGAQVDLLMLPKDTTRHFSRDPTTGSLLWFPSAPTNAPGRYSLEYLHWRAMKSAKKSEEDV